MLLLFSLSFLFRILVTEMKDFADRNTGFTIKDYSRYTESEKNVYFEGDYTWRMENIEVPEIPKEN